MRDQEKHEKEEWICCLLHLMTLYYDILNTSILFIWVVTGVTSPVLWINSGSIIIVTSNSHIIVTKRCNKFVTCKSNIIVTGKCNIVASKR